MKLPPEDWFFLLGLFIVTGLVICHVEQAGVVAALVGSHKAISVVDGKFRDRIDDDDEPDDPEGIEPLPSPHIKVDDVN